MSNTNTLNKSGGKIFLGGLLSLLIFLSALVLAACMCLRTKGGTVLSAYESVLGEGLVGFLSGALCFWLAFSIVVLFFILYIIAVRRIPSAIKALGVGCSLAAIVVLGGELLNLLLSCTFKMDNAFAACADALPSQFGDGCGDNVLFMLWSMIIASVGIFLCKVQKLPKTIKADSVSAKSAPAKESEPVSGECPFCGKDNPSGVKFCGGCGAKL